jgi:hypothetical protein
VCLVGGSRKWAGLVALVLGIASFAFTSEASATTTTVSNPAPTDAISWLAAGDSYASGQGLTRTTKPCAQGTGAKGLGSTWAIVAAQVLRSSKFGIKSGSPDLVACTGAVTDDFFNRQATNKPPQWTKKSGRYDLVTFSFGGDDIDFEDVVKQCTLTHCPPDGSVRQQIAALGTTGVTLNGRHLPTYQSFLQHVATAAVNQDGNIVVMGYPELIEDPALWGANENTCAGFTIADADTARGWAGDLNATLGNAVEAVNALPASKRNGVHVTFIDPVTGQSNTGVSLSDPYLFEPSGGTRHELCSNGHDTWLNGVSDLHVLTRSFHPNQQGETAMGKLAAEVIRNLTWSDKPQPLQLVRNTDFSPVTFLIPSNWTHSQDEGGGGSTSIYTFTDPADPNQTIVLNINRCTGCIAAGLDSSPGITQTTTASGKPAIQSTVVSPDRTFDAGLEVVLPTAEASVAQEVANSLAIAPSATETDPPSTTTTSPPGAAALCDATYINVVVQQYATNYSETVQGVSQFGCSGDFAWAYADVTTSSGSPISVTVLMMVQGNAWQPASRAIYCTNGSVPSDIYFNACETQ